LLFPLALVVLERQGFFVPTAPEKGKKVSGKVVATNKKAYHDYFIDDILEAGMVLKGSEVKSLRAGKANLKDGFAKISNGEVFLYNVNISTYSHATYDAPDAERVRKLLLKRREIKKLITKIQEKGFSLIPLKIYFIGSGKAKIELGLGRGKKLYDKRASLRQKDSDRDVARVMSRYK
jgi:SsrA-binding protein